MEKLRDAWTTYRLREFPAALRKFEMLEAATPPGSGLNLWALYGQACCWNYRQDTRDPEKAAELYNKILATVKSDHPLASWSAFDLVRRKHLARADVPLDYEDLTKSYAEVAKKYPGTAAGTEALLYQLNMESSAALRDPSAIAADAEAYTDANPKSPYTFRFYQLIAGCYQKLKQSEKYLTYMAKMLEVQEKDTSNPNFENAGLYWRLAYEAEFVVGDFEVARKYYMLILKEYPRDIRTFGTEEALKRMDEVEAALREGREIPAKWMIDPSKSRTAAPLIPAAATQEGK